MCSKATTIHASKAKKNIMTNYSPQAGLGEPTWPVKKSLSSMQVIMQEFSVIP